MNIYLLERISDVGYDEMAAAVVRARSPQSARDICASNAGQETPMVWIDLKCSTVRFVGRCSMTRPEGLILKDFRTG